MRKLIIVPDRLFHKLWDMALKADDERTFVTFCGNSIKYEDIRFDYTSFIYFLRELYKGAHLSFHDIVLLSGYRKADISHMLCVGYRTIEMWDSGDRECPPYIRLILLKYFYLFDFKGIRLESEVRYLTSFPRIYKSRKEDEKNGTNNMSNANNVSNTKGGNKSNASNTKRDNTDNTNSMSNNKNKNNADHKDKENNTKYMTASGYEFDRENTAAIRDAEYIHGLSYAQLVKRMKELGIDTE